jgi:hypothetical protein
MIIAALIATVVTLSPPPPPPYDWDAPSQDFAPFVIEEPNGTPITIWAKYPDEGRRLCDYERQYAELGPLNCRIEPIALMPDVTQPGWANPFAPPSMQG